jgi:hypothetical protein
LTFHSFQDLKDSVNFEFVCPPNRHDSELKNDENVQNPDFEEDLFGKAMEGVTPILRDNSVERICQVDPPEGFRDKEDAEILSKLETRRDKGFTLLIRLNTSRVMLSRPQGRCSVFTRETIDRGPLIFMDITPG